ncbi:hypothetical protein COO60DRAFT_188063 [Scenedesmus sp. NREL 46B-D3]|nr:hypothetical protein COO60DRAFT_188063 [Scenedesmus sp. NREL 46B-D3]
MAGAQLPPLLGLPQPPLSVSQPRCLLYVCRPELVRHGHHGCARLAAAAALCRHILQQRHGRRLYEQGKQRAAADFFNEIVHSCRSLLVWCKSTGQVADAGRHPARACMQHNSTVLCPVAVNAHAPKRSSLTTCRDNRGSQTQPPPAVPAAPPAPSRPHPGPPQGAAREGGARRSQHQAAATGSQQRVDSAAAPAARLPAAHPATQARAAPSADSRLLLAAAGAAGCVCQWCCCWCRSPSCPPAGTL